MATEVVTRVWCDRHLRTGEQEPGRARTFDGVTLDLCDPCDSELLDELRELLRSMGRRSNGKPARVEQRDETLNQRCLLCTRAYKNASTLSTHLGTEHRTTMAALSLNQCPLCPEVTTNTSALGAHVKREHNSASVLSAYVEAREQGDELGRVAEALARWNNTQTDKLL